MSAAVSRGWRKAVRTLLQLVAAGALTGVVNQITDGLSANVKVYVLAGWTVLITLAQNTLEAAGTIPTLFPSPGLVPSTGMAGTTVGTVDTAVDQAGGAVGEVTGTVESTSGELLGEVVDVDHEPDDDG